MAWLCVTNNEKIENGFPFEASPRHLYFRGIFLWNWKLRVCRITLEKNSRVATRPRREFLVFEVEGSRRLDAIFGYR